MEEILGVLINDRKLRKSIHKRINKASFGLYHKYGSALGVRVCFFTVNSIDLQEQKARVYYFDKGKEWVDKIVPIPKFIHNRAVHTKMADIRTIRKLRGNGKSILFNPVCSYKWENARRILMTDAEIAHYIPVLKKCTTVDMSQAISNFDELLVWSPAGSRKGIVEISKQNGLYHFWLFKKGQQEKGILSKVGIEAELAQMLGTEEFFLQEKILFNQYHENPYHLHMTMQKDCNGEWSFSGMIARMYDPTYFPQKRKMTSLSIDALSLPHNQLEKLKNIAKRASELLERFIPQLSDLCFSFSLSSDGCIRLLEAKLLDKRIWYKEAGEMKMWEDCHRKPIEYGYYLLSQHARRESYDLSYMSS